MRRGCFAAIVAFGLLVAHACDRAPTLPAELQRADAQPPPVDSRFIASLTGSESITAAGLVLELAADDNWITLRSDTGGTAAIYLSGMRRTTATRPEGAIRLSSVEYDVVGPGAKWVEGSAGIRTPTWRYQPDSAVIRVDSIDDQQARGRIDGRFYRFRRVNRGDAPATPESIKGSFTAKVVR